MTSTDTAATVVSGIQPSGTLHIGNYFGALRQHLRLHTQQEAFYFIVNYHALTTVRDAEALERYSLDVALDYLALGFNPDEAALFLQSDVPAVTELAWILLCLTPVSHLEKGVSYKDKVAQGIPANAGLLTYPILQAADILIYRKEGAGLLVPVGKDQKQHIEMTRDVAARFNQAFCPEEEPLFPLPEPLILDDVAVVPGVDGRKMSKSYGNTIEIFDEGKRLKKTVMGIITDSTPLEEPKDPEADNVFALIKLFADDAKREEIAAAYRAGGYGYGHAKKELLGLITDYFAEARERRKNLAERPDFVRDVLRDGAARANARTNEVMAAVRERVGLVTLKNSYAQLSRRHQMLQRAHSILKRRSGQLFQELEKRKSPGVIYQTPTDVTGISRIGIQKKSIPISKLSPIRKDSYINKGRQSKIIGLKRNRPYTSALNERRAKNKEDS